MTRTLSLGREFLHMCKGLAEAILTKRAACDILITHSPPKGLGDVTSEGRSVESPAIATAIACIQPGLAVCGHIHDSWGARDHIGRTEVVNLGPSPNWFNVKLS